MGTVYLANTTPYYATYTVNWGATFPGRPCSTGGALPIWTPRFVIVDERKTITAGVFGYGTNTVSVTFDGMTPPDPGHSFPVVLSSDSHSVDDPVVVYAFFGALAVLTGAGYTLPPNPPLVTGDPLG